MNEDTTRDLSNRSFEERVLAEFAALRQEVGGLRQEVDGIKQDVHSVKLVINEMNRNLHATNQRLTTLEGRFDTLEGRFDALEEKADARLRETRPMWEAVLVQLREVKDGIALLNAKVTELIRDSMAIRARVVLLEEREQTPIA